MKPRARLAIIGTAVAALAAVAAPAMADSSIAVSLSSGSGTRTLYLFQPDGTTPLTSTDLSSGTSNFIAKVTDSAFSNSNFTVQATMSNLYAFPNGQYDCTKAPVPSSAITLSSPTGLLSVDGVSANLTPVFNLTGTLTPLEVPGLTSPVPINLNVDGILPTTQSPLSQSQLTGSSVTNLIGSSLATLESQLPISLGTTGLGGNFASPAPHPSCMTTVPNPATQVQVMSGTADPTGLLADLKTLIQSTLGGNATPTVTQLIDAVSSNPANGYLTSSAVSTALQGVPALISQLGIGGLANQTVLTDIENNLTGTVASVTTLPGSVVQTGNYSSSPDLAVDATKIPANGTFKGVMTVTMVSG